MKNSTLEKLNTFEKSVVKHTQLRAAWHVLAIGDHDVFVASSLSKAECEMIAARRTLLEAIALRTPKAA